LAIERRGAVAAHLSRNARAILISSPEVVDRVRAAAPGLAAGRLRGLLPAPGASELVTIDGVPIRVLRVRHNPARRLPEQHVAFLIGDAATVLHTGDADPKAENFTVLRGLPRVHLALVPYWFLLSETNRTFVQEAIAPQRIAAMHVPPQGADDVRSRFAAAGVRPFLLVTPGTVVP